MGSINLSDFFHDMLITQAFWPVIRCGDQWFLRLLAALVEGLGQKKSPADVQGDALGQWVVQNIPVRRSNENYLGLVNWRVEGSRSQKSEVRSQKSEV